MQIRIQMIGKFTTESLVEYKENPDLIFLSPQTLGKIRIVKIRRCVYCKTILGKYDKENKYCSDWCKEQTILERRKENKIHECFTCGEIVDCPVYKTTTRHHKAGTPTHVFPKYCKECRKPKVDKSLDF